MAAYMPRHRTVLEDSVLRVGFPPVLYKGSEMFR